MLQLKEIFTENATYGKSNRRVKDMSFSEKRALARIRRKEVDSNVSVVVAGYNDSTKTFVIGYLKYILSIFTKSIKK